MNTKSKSKKIWNVLSVVIWIALLASELLAGVLIWQLDILPTKLLVIVYGVFLFAALLTAVLMFVSRDKWRKMRRHAHRAIAYILSVVVITGCLVVSHAIAKLQETMSAVTETTTVAAVVDVYVPKEDPAQSIEDARDYTFAVTESYDWENTQKAISAIQERLGVEVKTVRYPSVFAMVDALYANEADALILNSAYVDILVELEGYTDFADRVRVIWEHRIEEIVQKEPHPNGEGTLGDTSAGSEETDEIAPFLLYISGSDTRSKVLTTSRSDVNILAVVNPQTKQILLVNTPRDYYVANPAGNGALDKLTHCGIYGVDCSMKALGELYDEEIDYYAQINFTGFETLIDAVGGITIHSDVSFTTLHGKYLIRVGDNHLNGSEALGYARERYALAGGDNDRGKNQMKVIKAVIDKLSVGTLVTNYADVLDSLKGMFVTNMSQEVISRLMKMHISDKAAWNVRSYAVTGYGGSERTYSMPGMNAYVMHPNESTVALASEWIDRVMAGEVLTTEDISNN